VTKHPLRWITALSAAAVVGALLVLSLGGNVAPTPGPAGGVPGLPYPQSIRVPISDLGAHGLATTVVDASTVPAGSIVSQQTAEIDALPTGNGTVIGSVLVNAQGALGPGNAPGLYWVVSIEPVGQLVPNVSLGNATLPPNQIGNYDDIYVNASTGQIATEVWGVDSSYPPLPTSAARPTPIPTP